MSKGIRGLRKHETRKNKLKYIALDEHINEIDAPEIC